MSIQNTADLTANRSNLKRNLGYWIPTVLLAFGMGMGGVFDALQTPEAVESVGHLGYPAYFCMWLGIAKLLGVAAILIPGSRTLREWAYAGFTFDILAAIVSVASVDHTSSPAYAFALALIYFSRRGWLRREA
ncbi:MAG TPA: DoxX family protein [Polyangiales bacterium]|nr:DoxX family protein [Polyangiales bacterium]